MKKVENTIPQSGQKLSILFEQVPYGIHLLDLSGNFLDVNTPGCLMLGYEKEELLKLNIRSLIPEENLLSNPLKLEELNKGIPLIFERKFIRKNGSVIDVEIFAQKLQNENIQGIIRDITEQKQTNELFRKSLYQLEEAQKIAHTGHLDLDLVAGEIKWSNETFRIHGCDPDKFKPTLENTVDFVHPEDAAFVQKELHLAMAGKKKYDLQHRIINANGETVYVRVKADLSFDPSGKPVKMLGTITDITEITQIKHKQELSARVLELLAKDAPLPTILETMVLGAEQYSSGSFCSILLADKEGKRLLHGAAPNLPDFYNKAIHGVEIGMSVGSCGTAAFTGKRVIVDNIQTHPYWKQFKELAGKAGLAACWSEPILDASGIALGSFAIYRAEPSSPKSEDIEMIEQLAKLSAIVLERHYASAALKESEEKYRELIEQASDGIFIFDSKGNFLDVNTSGSLLTGYIKEDIQNLGIKDIIDKEELIAKPLKLKELSEGKHLIFERKVKRKDGSLIEAEISAKILHNGNFLAIMRDITERKKAELALQESEKKLALTLNSTTDLMGLAKINKKGEFIFTTANKANRELIKNLGIDEKNYFGAEFKAYCMTYLGFTIEEALEGEKKNQQVVKERKSVKTQSSYQDPQGNIYYSETTINPVVEEDGTVKQVLYVTRDTTEAKKAELALKASERKLALTLDSTVDMMGLMDINSAGEFIFNSANRATREFLKLTQIDEQNYFGAELKAYCINYLGYTKGEALVLEKKYRQVVKERKPIIVSSSSPNPQRGLIHMETTINPVFGDNGKIEQVLWVNKDVTEAKKTEEQLLISKQKLLEAQKIAKIGNWEFSLLTGEIYWSDEEYLIYELEGTPNNKLYEAYRNKLIPEDLQKLDELIEMTVEKGESFSFEQRIICKDGSIKHILGLTEPTKDNDGNVIGLKGTSQDITSKIESQKRQLQSMILGEENERKRLAAELHDGLGQTLSLISLNLDSVLNLEEKKRTLAQQKLHASLEMVNQTIEEIRSISHGLIPPALEDFGLESELEDMFNKAHLSTGIIVDFSFDSTIGRCESNVEINIYRIVQEALHNTLKHADARKISISIDEKEGFISILYKDDGKGFDPAENKKTSSGLKNIENRVFVLEGTLSVQSIVQQGSTLSVKIPI